MKYENGSAGIDSKSIAEVSLQPYELFNNKNPIAILTGPETASSGVTVITAFRKKVNTRSFGEGTSGLSTGNMNFEISDGSMIFLATTVFADRERNHYGNKIIPDEEISFSYQKIGSFNDEVIARAINWIHTK